MRHVIICSGLVGFQEGQDTFFHGFVAFRGNVMFHFAGIAGGNLWIDPQMDQPVRQQGMAFIDILSQFPSLVCQENRPLLLDGVVPVLFHVFHGNAYAGF